MSKSVFVKDPITGDLIYLGVKGFLRGALVGNRPTVAVVLSSKQGDLIGHFELAPEDAHTLGEYIRQEAELASIAQEEDNL